MPVYEYACGACGHQFEEWQKMSDAPVRTCPKCKKKKVERLISRTAFQLKGGGWYADLYSSSKGGNSDKGEGGSSSSEGSGKDGGKDGSKSDGSPESGKKESGKKEGGKQESGASTSTAKADSGKADASSSKSDPGGKSNAGSARGAKNPAKKSDTRAA